MGKWRVASCTHNPRSTILHHPPPHERYKQPLSINQQAPPQSVCSYVCQPALSLSVCLSVSCLSIQSERWRPPPPLSVSHSHVCPSSPCVVVLQWTDRWRWSGAKHRSARRNGTAGGDATRCTVWSLLCRGLNRLRND